MSVLHMELGERGYDITVERGALARVGELLRLERRVLILTDDGVPAAYAEAVAKCCGQPTVVTLPMGEQNKCIETYTDILRRMISEGFDRGDCVVAVGGGVMGDLGGFVAATYMRGIDFYNIPTTLLSQIDSSIGGKVAVDLDGYKNIVGAFYQPKAVVIDPNVLQTLDARQFRCGMAEAIKIFATFDAEMFRRVEREGKNINVDQVILRALELKKMVVEQDERESGLRRVLNFGHTTGHAIERLGGLLHGECVALGMLCMSAPQVRERIAAVLCEFGLATAWQGSAEALRESVLHDKKAGGNAVTAIIVDEIGTYRQVKLTAEQIVKQSGEVLELI